MKVSIFLSAAALTGCVVIAFAAEQKKDPCTETYDQAVQKCENEKANCRARGSDEGACDERFDACKQAATKAKKNCEAKSGKSPSPTPTPGKKK